MTSSTFNLREDRITYTFHSKNSAYTRLGELFIDSFKSSIISALQSYLNKDFPDLFNEAAHELEKDNNGRLGNTMINGFI